MGGEVALMNLPCMDSMAYPNILAFPRHNTKGHSTLIEVLLKSMNSNMKSLDSLETQPIHMIVMKLNTIILRG